MISALASRYSSIVLLPYYLALGSQILASLYAFTFVPETLPPSDRKAPSDAGTHTDDEDDNDDEEDNEGGIREVLEDTMEAVIAPVQPLGLLMPHRNEKTGKVEWRLFLVTISLLATTCGVSLPIAVRRPG